MRNEQIITITETDITLPSGHRIAIDRDKAFTPNPEFWALWHANKLEIKRAGVCITRDRHTGAYQGIVRAGQGINYTEKDLHQYWREQAQARADSPTPCEPVLIAWQDVPSEITPPCRCRTGNYRVAAKVCRDGAIQLRLKCEKCEARTPGAIAWNALGAEVVIGALAHALENAEANTSHTSLLSELRDVKWV